MQPRLMIPSKAISNLLPFLFLAAVRAVEWRHFSRLASCPMSEKRFALLLRIGDVLQRGNESCWPWKKTHTRMEIS